jgi:hypothetical protein
MLPLGVVTARKFTPPRIHPPNCDEANPTMQRLRA